LITILFSADFPISVCDHSHLETPDPDNPEPHAIPAIKFSQIGFYLLPLSAGSADYLKTVFVLTPF
jgi:hypothetical protein